MKRFKKLASLLLALVMVLAMSTTAFAATTSAGSGDGTITVTNAVEGETYTAYKMLNLSYNSTTESYSYTIADGWEGFITAENGFTISGEYVTGWTATTTITSTADLAKAALAYAQSSSTISAAGSVVADADGATITGLDLGYYLVDTSLGTLCSIDSTDTTAEIVEKNSATPTEDKTVANSEDGTYSESNTASIGDTVYYKVELTNLANKSNVSLVDTLSKGLTLTTTEGTPDVTVTVGGSTVTSGYTATVTTNSNGTTTLTVTFTDEYLATLSSNAVITVAYSATINEDAVIGTDGNTNSAVLNYGTGHTVTDTTKTTVFEFELKKVDNKGNQLNGATFTLEDSDGNLVYFVTDADGNYQVTSSTTSGASSTITVGNVTIYGLAAGTYTLTETAAPTGYNLLSDSISVVIGADGTITMDNESVTSVEVVNQAGSSLPSTGGIGTTIFYVVGTIMVLGAVVVLITRKRMSAQ